MKKAIAALIAVIAVSAPLAEASAQSFRQEPPHRELRDRNWKKPVVKRWHRGERLTPGIRAERLGPGEVRRFRLPPPRPGEAWVRVGPQLLLVAGNGYILAVAGR